MICPKCGWSESNHLQAKKSDKDHYLEFWGYTLGSPEAEQAWKEKQEMTFREAPMVISDIPGHISMADGTWVDSRSKHRENLKRNGCIELGNDVPMKRPEAQISTKSQEARKRQIAELAYAKLNYR
jgi:hypothetical protein